MAKHLGEDLNPDLIVLETIALPLSYPDMKGHGALVAILGEVMRDALPLSYIPLCLDMRGDRPDSNRDRQIHNLPC